MFLDQTRTSLLQSDPDSDVDGAPLEPVKPGTGRTGLPAGFVPSKWETVDPEDVQAQAVTSKWDIFDQVTAIFLQLDAWKYEFWTFYKKQY